MKQIINLLSVIVELLKVNTLKNKRWLSPLELYVEYGFKENTMDKYRMEGKIPFSKVSTLIRYDRIKIDKWLENHEVVSLNDCTQKNSE